MARLRVRFAIDFNEEEAGWVGGFLEEVEAGNARLLDAFPGIGQGRLLKSRDALWFDVDVNMNDQHGINRASFQQLLVLALAQAGHLIRGQ